MGLIVVVEGGRAVAVTVATCRPKSEASDLGTESSGCIVRVGRMGFSDRGASLCNVRNRERSARGSDDRSADTADDDSRGAMEAQEKDGRSRVVYDLRGAPGLPVYTQPLTW